ncbi:MAG: hypothetical protein HQL21_04185 [Candidatus Omnitrophica bacterium]|nr:hypothetical protein [Candidatus Omnitrophota bacterium]
MEKKSAGNPKVVILLVLISFCFIAVLVFGGWLVSLELQYKTYFNEKNGFRIKYPKTWTVSTKAIPGMIAGFVSPKEGPLDLFLENVAVTSTELSAELATLDKYADATVQQMTSVFKNLQVSKPVEVEMSGHPGKKIVLKSADNGGSVIVIYAFVFQKKAYNITYMGSARSYVKDQRIIRDMIYSLKVFF